MRMLSLVVLVMVLAVAPRGGRATAAETMSDAAPSAEAVNTDQTGLAIHGYDPVAYFEDGRPMRGNFQITASHLGATYWFANEQNQQKFTADPDRFVPRYGGYCAFGVAIGKKLTGDPEVWQIEAGKLYLNVNRDISAKFNEDLAGNLEKAEQNWPKVDDVPASKL